MSKIEEKMQNYCGTNCCSVCKEKNVCAGCIPSDAHPFGGCCVAAECVRKGGLQALERCRRQLIDEINAFAIPGLHLDDLHLLHGAYVNLGYPLANGSVVKFLQDEQIVWGNQIEIPGNDRCYGVVADEEKILVCTYGCGGSDPELLLYKKRQSK